MAFVFHDCETTGLDTTFDQILQFAAVRTDDDLEVTDRIEVRCRILPHVVPHPSALAMTGQTLASLADPALPSHYVMMREVAETLERWSPAVFIGFNSLGFDERMLHQAFYQTLHYPYLTSRPGNGRADALALCRSAAFFTPGALAPALNGDGLPSFRLADLSAANGGPVADHVAAADVAATLHLCRTVREREEECWSRFLRFAGKPAVCGFLETEPAFGVVGFAGNAPRPVVATLLGAGVVDGNVRYCLDLAADLDALLAASDDALGEALTARDGPVTRVRVNGGPAICPLYDMPAAALGGLDEAVVERRAERVRTEPGLGARMLRILVGSERPFARGTLVEQRIHGEWPCEEDWATMRDFHCAGWAERAALVGRIRDPRYRNLGQRVLYLEAPGTLDPGRVARIRAGIAARLAAPVGGGGPRSVADALAGMVGQPADAESLALAYRSMLT